VITLPVWLLAVLLAGAVALGVEVTSHARVQRAVNRVLARETSLPLLGGRRG
jgi:hypothetical protein